MVFFQELYSHIQTRTQGKKFEDMFLVKIARKGTSLIPNLLSQMKIRINIDHQLQTQEYGMEETGPDLDCG